VYNWTNIAPGSGSYWGYVGWPLPLDGRIPFSVTLDPGHVTGNTNVAHSTYHGAFTPVPPKTAVQYFNPVTRTGSETFTVDWNPGGEVTSGFTLMGCPATGTYQTVVSDTGPTGATQVTTNPGGDPVWESSYSDYFPTTGSAWVNTNDFSVTLSASRVNPNTLKRVTWADLANIPTAEQCYLVPDTLVQSTDPAITGFVASVLPSDYKTSMTPYAAARALFLAIVKRTTYELTDPDISSVATLNTKMGDCGGFSDLLSACIQSIGIPARTDCGFWEGTDQWHCFTEFYLPKCGRIQADATEDELYWDPTGTYSCMFGAMPFLNEICIVSRGSNHYTSQFTISVVQVGWVYYYGTASASSYADTCSLSE
jgi:transglutaminase-like putative cysteine protease